MSSSMRYECLRFGATSAHKTLRNVYVVMVINYCLKRCALFRSSMAQVSVSKEYVRQQLNSMGVRELTEEDLDAYTNGTFLPISLLHEEAYITDGLISDFSRLLHEHLQEVNPDETSSGESFVSTNSSETVSVQGMYYITEVFERG